MNLGSQNSNRGQHLDSILNIAKNQIDPDLSRKGTDKVYFRSHMCFNCTVDLGLGLRLVLGFYSVRHLMNGWDLKYTFSKGTKNNYVKSIQCSVLET